MREKTCGKTGIVPAQRPSCDQPACVPKPSLFCRALEWAWAAWAISGDGAFSGAVRRYRGSPENHDIFYPGPKGIVSDKRR